MKPLPEAASVFVRDHTRVKGEKPRDAKEWSLPQKWANFALVFDCETTTDISEDLNFLWWRFCELKNAIYVCQQEGLVYADHLEKESVSLIREYARRRQADVEDGSPTVIRVQSRTQFVNSEFWKAI